MWIPSLNSTINSKISSLEKVKVEQTEAEWFTEEEADGAMNFSNHFFCDEGWKIDLNT